MKTVKGLIAGGVLASVLVFGGSINVYAATNQDTIAALNSAGVNAVYVTKADNFLKSANLSAAQLDQVDAQINVVSSIMKAANVTDVTKLNQADKAKVMAAITAAAKDANLTATFGKNAAGFAFVSLTNASGVEVFRASASDLGLKVTGAEVPATLYAGLFLVLAAGVLLARRPKLIAVK